MWEFTRRGFERLAIAKPPVNSQEPNRMNTHKNARLTYLRRLEMVQDIIERGFSASEAAAICSWSSARRAESFSICRSTRCIVFWA